MNFIAGSLHLKPQLRDVHPVAGVMLCVFRSGGNSDTASDSSVRSGSTRTRWAQIGCSWGRRVLLQGPRTGVFRHIAFRICNETPPVQPRLVPCSISRPRSPLHTTACSSQRCVPMPKEVHPCRRYRGVVHASTARDEPVPRLYHAV